MSENKISIPKISTFILVKDEASTIGKTLESAAKFSDEIVLGIDESTTDNTLHVIGRFAPNFPGEIILYTYKWMDSFSKARNYAMDRCTGDWIMQLDAHEVLRDGDEQRISFLAQNIPDQIKVVSFIMLDEWRNGEPTARFNQDKFFRNVPEVRYSGDMHNFIPRETVKSANRLMTDEIAVYHQRTNENNARRRKQRIMMAEKIFLPLIESDPKNCRAAFYLAQTYLNCLKMRSAEKFYLEYCHRSEALGIPHDSEYSWALYKLGLLSVAIKKDYEKALEYFEKALRYRSDSPWIYHHIAEINRIKKRYREAAHNFIIAANTKADFDQLFQFQLAESYGAWLGLAEVYVEQEKWDQSYNASMMGLQANPNVPRLLDIAKRSIRNLALKVPAVDPCKKNLYIIDATGQFTPPLIELWKNHYNIEVQKKADMVKLAWADIIFCEWGDENLIQASKHRFKAPLITRIHSYEVFNGNLDYVNWKNVDIAVFVCPDKMRMAGGLPVRRKIIMNAVDPEKFSLQPDPDPLSLCYIGRIVPEKNLAYLIQLLSEVDPAHEFILHVAGYFQSVAYNVFIKDQLKKLNMMNNVVFHGWVDDINSWIEKYRPSAILSASQRECTIPFGVQESMIKGCQPIVYPYPGAEDQYLPEMLFHNKNEFADRLYNTPKYPPYFWRDYLIQKYPFEKYKKTYIDLLTEALNVRSSLKEHFITPYSTRLDIITKHGRGKKVMEIGVYRGDFSKQIYNVDVDELHLVDPWIGPGNSGDKDGNNKISVPDISVFYPQVCEFFNGKPNVKIARMKSEDYLKTVPDNYFDLIYIDGNHSYYGAMSDLEMAYHKVKAGGWIAGHDYGPIGINDEVIAAVNDFVYKHKYDMEITTDDGRPSFAFQNHKT